MWCYNTDPILLKPHTISYKNNKCVSFYSKTIFYKYPLHLKQYTFTLFELYET